MKTLVKIFNKKGQRVIIGCLDVSGTLWVNRADPVSYTHLGGNDGYEYQAHR